MPMFNVDQHFPPRTCRIEQLTLELARCDARIANLERFRDELQASNTALLERVRKAKVERDEARAQHHAALTQAETLRRAITAIRDCPDLDVPDADFQRRAKGDLQEIARSALAATEPETIAKAIRDAVTYGTSFTHIDASGNIRTISPDEVFLPPVPPDEKTP